MLNIFATGKFKKDYKLAGKRGLNISLLTEVIEKLQRQEPLEAKYKEESNKLEAKYKEESNELDNNYKIELDKNRAPIKEKLNNLENTIKIITNKREELVHQVTQKLIKDIKIDKIVEEGLNKEETVRKCSANVTFKYLNGNEDSIKSRIDYLIKKSDNGDLIEVKKL